MVLTLTFFWFNMHGYVFGGHGHVSGPGLRNDPPASK
jgi:hypothetical protein